MMMRVPHRRLTGTAMMLAVWLFMAPAVIGESVGTPLMVLPGADGRDLDGMIGPDGRYTVFHIGSGKAVGAGRMAWVSGAGSAGEGPSAIAAGLLPAGRSQGVTAYGPAAMLLPGDGRPSVAWAERQGDRCAIRFCRPAPGGCWTAPEAVFPGTVDLVRFLHGCGPWLVWVESRTYDDDIVACRRGPDGWERPMAVSARDTSEDLAPRVAVDASGAPWVVWAGSRDGGRDDILVSRFDEGRWTGEQLVGAGDDTPDVLPDLAINGEGRACAVWLGYARDTRDYRVTASFSTDGRAWSKEVQLGQGSYARPPRLALLENGRFLAVWGDAGGVCWWAESRGEAWSSPRAVRLFHGDAAARRTAALLLIHRDGQGNGLVAVPRSLP